MYPPEPWNYSEYLPGQPASWAGESEPPDPACVHLGEEATLDNVLLYVAPDRAEREADGIVRRVAACVNACAGIPTEDLERLGDGELLTVCSRLLLTPEPLRDQILARLKGALVPQ